MHTQQKIEDLLAKADIRINGDRPWDIQVHDKRLFRRVLAQGSLGLGEAYMDGWWDCAALDDAIDRAHRSGIKNQAKSLAFIIMWLKSRLFNLQSSKRSYIVGEKHYDVGNDLYERMLDKRMTYSCGYWQDASTLDEAQEAKLDLICRKLGFQKGMKVLDIGCGWGSFAQFAAEKYGVEVLGITISREQAKLAQERTKGLSVEIRLQDYRQLNEKFDRVVSIGMFEHVGYKNHKIFMEVVSRSLKGGGLFLLHTIGRNVTRNNMDPWFDKYIFPNGMLPSIKQIGMASEKLFVMEDWHSFGADYDPTLMAWHKNFIASWDSIKHNYDERFKRMWTYYLLSTAGGFRTRHNQLWQIVLSKGGVPGGYESIR